MNTDYGYHTYKHGNSRHHQCIPAAKPGMGKRPLPAGYFPDTEIGGVPPVSGKGGGIPRRNAYAGNGGSGNGRKGAGAAESRYQGKHPHL